MIEIAYQSYQPHKAELEEDMSIDVTPEELARAVNLRIPPITPPEASP